MVLVVKVKAIDFYRFRLQVSEVINPLETKAVIELDKQNWVIFLECLFHEDYMAVSQYKLFIARSFNSFLAKRFQNELRAHDLS